MPYLFFKRVITPDPVTARLPRGFTLEFWRPGWFQLLPRGFPVMPFLGWGWFHALRLFRSRDYAIVLIFEGETLMHRTCLLPAHFRFPFMRPGDLQAAGIWTHPDQRGRGLALIALQAVFHRLEDPARTLWYMVREDNHGSIRLAEKAGFRPWGRGLKQAPLGIGPLGVFRITEGPNPRALARPGRHQQGLPGAWSRRRSRQPTPGD